VARPAGIVERELTVGAHRLWMSDD
jgi:hypothetical protein